MSMSWNYTYVVEALESQNPVPGWQESRWLRGQLVMAFDSSLSASIEAGPAFISCVIRAKRDLSWLNRMGRGRCAMNENVSFNLIDEPWILVRDTEGEMREVSLMELFEQAPRIRRLANDLPTQDFAILRVLLAILQRSISPTLDDDDDPRRFGAVSGRRPSFPIAAIREYLDKWHGRFDLFDEEKPFMQVAGLRTERNEISSITKIIADIPDGDALFSLRVGKGAESLTYSEAARWLVHVQAFDTSGIKSGTVGDPRVKGGKSYPIGTGWSGNLGGLYFEGATLSETILLNFIVRGTEDDELFFGRGSSFLGKGLRRTAIPAGVVRRAEQIFIRGNLEGPVWLSKTTRSLVWF